MEAAIWRTLYVLGGLALTIAVGLSILDARFESGLAPIPFIATAYVLGAALMACVRLLVRSRHAYRAVIAVAIVLAALAGAGGGWRAAFWFAAIPGAGALAVSLPAPERPLRNEPAKRID